MMTVRLIAHTPEPEKVVAAAAKLCYSDAHITDLLDGLTEEKTAKFLTMLSDLGHASPLDAKGKAGMFNGAGMAQIAEHSQELRGLFLGQAVQQVGDVRIRIAELCRCGHYLFGFRGMGDQTNSHHKCVIPPQ